MPRGGAGGVLQLQRMGNRAEGGLKESVRVWYQDGESSPMLCSL